MKKTITFLLIFLSFFFLSACKEDENTKTEPTDTFEYNFTLVDYMHTRIRVNYTTESEAKALELRARIEDTYRMYHQLTTNHEALPQDSTYLQNIFSINHQIGDKLEIDYELYEILKMAMDLYDLTEGHFDIRIGKIVDAWKAVIVPEILPEIGDQVFLIEQEIYAEVTNVNLQDGRIMVKNDTHVYNRLDYKQDITKQAFDYTVTTASNIDISNFNVELFEEEGKYFVKLTGDDIKLDLGAISKGFATQKATDILREEGIEYFFINAGTSSIALGKNPRRQNDVFYVGLANPIRTSTSKDDYGTFYIKDHIITTSGNYEQYIIYEGLRYHHIVSPFTKAPTHDYHTVTIIGDDAGITDAISTAFFVMSIEQIEAWLDIYQDLYNIDVIIFHQNRTISKYLVRDLNEDF